MSKQRKFVLVTNYFDRVCINVIIDVKSHVHFIKGYDFLLHFKIHHPDILKHVSYFYTPCLLWSRGSRWRTRWVKPYLVLPTQVSGQRHQEWYVWVESSTTTRHSTTTYVCNRNRIPDVSTIDTVSPRWLRVGNHYQRTRPGTPEVSPLRGQNGRWENKSFTRRLGVDGKSNSPLSDLLNFFTLTKLLRP